MQFNSMKSAGNFYAAGTTRFNLAIVLANNGRLSDALLYARAALRNFESYGGRAKDMEDKTKGLIAEIEEAMKRSRVHKFQVSATRLSRKPTFVDNPTNWRGSMS